MNEDNTRKSNFKIQLLLAQTSVTDLIALAKASCSAHQAGGIHNMSFNPKASWESVKILTGGTMSHHSKPTIMRMRLPTGKLATMDKDNVGVAGPHFDKVFNKHLPIEWKFINKIKKRQTMYELNEPITWAELKTAIAKLVNDKAHGLNNVPPNAFKSLSDQNLQHLLTFFNQYWKGEADLGNLCQYQKLANSLTQTSSAG